MRIYKFCLYLTHNLEITPNPLVSLESHPNDKRGLNIFSRMSGRTAKVFNLRCVILLFGVKTFCQDHCVGGNFVAIGTDKIQTIFTRI